MIFILKRNSNLNVLQGCSSRLCQDWSLLPVTPPVSGHPSQIGQPQTGSSSVGAVLPVDGDRSLPDLLGHALSDAAWMLLASSAMRANLHSFLSPELILSSQRTGQIRLSWRRAEERVAVSCGLLWGTIYMCFPCSLPPAKAQKVCWAYLKVISLHTHSDTSSLLRAGSCSASRPEFSLPSSYKLLKWCPVVCKLVPTDPDPVCSFLQGISRTSQPCSFFCPLCFMPQLTVSPRDPNIHHMKTQHATSNLSQCLCQGKCCLSSWLISLTN